MRSRIREISPTKMPNLGELSSMAPSTKSAGKKLRMQEYAEAFAVAKASCSNACQNAVLSDFRNFQIS